MTMTTFKALLLSLPTRSSTIRMRVWRTLKNTGCGVLRDGVYILPKEAPQAASLVELGEEVQSAGGFAMVVDLELASAEQLAHVRTLFDRTREYGSLVQRIKTAQTSSRRLGQRRAETTLNRLRRSCQELTAIDFYPNHARVQAEESLAALERTVHELFSGGEPRPSKSRVRRLRAATYRGRTWATRKRPWVDRLASAWLIKRFIDEDARFVWIDHPRERPKQAIGFDFDNAEFTHAGHRVTYEVLLASFGLEQDPALTSIGAAVHFLDIGGIPAPDAAGLETILKGIQQKSRNDDETLREAMKILDLMYGGYAERAR